MYEAKRPSAPIASEPLYALTASIGVFVFLLLVVLIYRAAPSPSTSRYVYQHVTPMEARSLLTNWHVQIHEDTVELCS